jgi:hypothetical protein
MSAEVNRRSVSIGSAAENSGSTQYPSKVSCLTIWNLCTRIQERSPLLCLENFHQDFLNSKGLTSPLSISNLPIREPLINSMGRSGFSSASFPRRYQYSICSDVAGSSIGRFSGHLLKHRGVILQQWSFWDPWRWICYNILQQGYASLPANIITFLTPLYHQHNLFQQNCTWHHL